MTPICPHCKKPLDDSDDWRERPGLRRRPHSRGVTTRFAFGDDTPAGATWQEFRRPARAANVPSDVATPALQAIVTALATAAIATVLVVAFALAWTTILVAFVAAFALAWWWRLQSVSATLWEVETYEFQPEVTEPKVVTRLGVSLANVHHERELPIAPDVLLRMSRSLSGGGHVFSERELVGAGLLTGRTQYEGVRDALLAMGWLRWKSASDRRQGVDWTPPGRAGLRALASGDMTVDDMRQTAV